jgi:mono/diheme cytochrome c family protein
MLHQGSFCRADMVTGMLQSNDGSLPSKWRFHFAKPTIFTALLIATVVPALANERVQQGRASAQRLCASCHAIDRGERSPIAAAPAFRRMAPRVDLDRMAERLQNGIVVGHPEMPAFVLKEQEARALIAYIRSLQAD